MKHKERKELKKRSFRTVRKHYGLLMILSLIAIMIGTEFSGGALFMHLTDSKLPVPATAVTEEISSSDRSFVLNDPGSDVFRDIISGNVIDGIELSNELEKSYADSGSGIMGHTEGVIASLVGTVTSGHLYVKAIQALLTITQSPRASIMIFVLLSLLLYSAFFVLINRPYSIMIRRMFMEARTYDKVPFHHLFHLKYTKRWVRASLGVIYSDFLYFLWFFTIAGAFIKRYSYYLVPFILAENPDIGPKQAVDLSRRMMDGHKMECFKLEISFLGWLALGFLTGGFLNAFFYAPYKMAAMTDYYAVVRREAYEKGLSGIEALDDHYLMDPAEPDLLAGTYRDLSDEKKELDKYSTGLTGVRKIFADNFAIWLGSMEAKEKFQKIENRRFELEDDMNAAKGLSYPDRLDPRLREDPLLKRIHTEFLRCYTIWNLLLMFFMFAFIGWLWEVMLFMIQTGEFVNRGSLYGPWVPIYGVGGTLIIVILCKLRTRPIVLFFATAVLCGVVEYLTSYIQEMDTGMRYWDYSGYFLNLNGRICAEGLFAFAVLGSIAIYFIAPMIDSMLMRVDNRIIAGTVLGLSVIFTGDAVYAHFHPHTGKGITDMGSINERACILCKIVYNNSCN